MDAISIVLISVGLAMDSFTVSLCRGMGMTFVRVREAVRIALCFGLFQALMPVAGWLGGIGFRDMIANYDHWVAFALLGIIGGKMVYESLTSGGDDCEKGASDTSSLWLLLILGVATSIDAMAVGLSFAFLGTSITVPVISIGVITAGLSFAGVYLGRRCGGFLQSKAELLGGVILISIGLRILVEHLGIITPGTMLAGA